jgi:hypothetical protein
LGGGVVGMRGAIYGQSPYPHRNNYVVVSPIKTGDNFVQSGPLNVGLDGSWSSSATYGSAAVGTGEEFMVRALATDAALSAGPLSNIPKDAVFSRPVVVVRKD